MRRTVIAGMVGVALAAGAAFGAPDAYWSVSASAPGLGSSTWLVPSSALSGGGAYTLNLGAYGSATLGSRLTAGRGGDGCPEVTLNFMVQSNAMVATNFVIASALLAFPPTGNTFGRLTAELKVVDTNGDGGALLTGVLPNGNAVGGYVNGYLDAGTLISSAFPSLVAPGEGMNTDTFDSGCITLNAITDISAQWAFKLSIGDQAMGSASWLVCEDCGQVIPLPSAAGLGLAGLATVASRRRRAN